MKTLLSIKEFSKLSGIEATTLRYWDDIGLFSPSMRNPDNNYRYYTPMQLIMVKFVTVMSDMNVNLKTINETGDERTPQSVMRLIDYQERLLNEEMHTLHTRHSVMLARRELIGYGLLADEKWVGIDYRPERPYILGPRAEFKNGDSFYEDFANLYERADELRINLSFPVASYHDSFEDFLKRPGKPDYFCSLDPTGNSKRPAGDYLIAFQRGFYGEFGDLPERIAAYKEKNSVEVSGPVYSIYLFDEISVKDPSDYLVQVCVAASGQSGKAKSGG